MLKDCSGEEHMHVAFVVINVFGTFIFCRQSKRKIGNWFFYFSTIWHSPPLKLIAFLPPSEMSSWFFLIFFLVPSLNLCFYRSLLKGACSSFFKKTGLTSEVVCISLTLSLTFKQDLSVEKILFF